MYSILIIFTYINILYNLIISKCIFKPIIQNLDDNLKMWEYVGSIIRSMELFTPFLWLSH